jgi:acetyl-CoA carboxylase biotin carboxyl carrier protein
LTNGPVDKKRASKEKAAGANSGGGSGDLFDVRKIRRLVELMNEHELSEIDLRQNEQRIRIRRGRPSRVRGGSGVESATQPTPVPLPPGASGPAPTAAAAQVEANVTLIKSPMVGTFYTAANPDSKPFVELGDVVNPDTTVCIIEAMKVFNEIPAECSGKVVAVLVDNGDPVEFGQPLFKVETR